MLHMKFENHGCSGFREKVIGMDLNGRVDINCEWKNRQTDGRMENGRPIAKADVTIN